MHWGKVNKTVGRRKSLIVLSKWKTASYSAKLLLKKIYMMMIISSSFCGLEISSSSEDTAAKKLTIFSVLIELSEATKSWHDTFVGTPGKNKLIENWIELISLHPPTCQIFNQENPWKSFFRSNFPCRFFNLVEPILQAYLSIRLSDSLFFRYIVDHPWQDSPINSSLQ